MANQLPSSKTRILVAGYGALGKAMLKQAPHCRWFSINRSHQSGAAVHIRADLLDESHYLPKEPIDFIIYTATPGQRTPEAYRKTYIEGLQRLLIQLKGRTLKRFIFVSSTSVYGQNQGEQIDESSPAEGAHFSGEMIAEGECLLAESGVDYTIVRFGGIYGPGREALLRMVKRGVQLVNNPAPFTNRIHEDDCAGVLLHLMAQAQVGAVESIYNAVDDDGADKAQVYQFIEQQLGLTGRVELLSQRPDDLGKRCINLRLKQTGYQFIYPSYREGYGELIRMRSRQLKTDSCY